MDLMMSAEHAPASPSTLPIQFYSAYIALKKVRASDIVPYVRSALATIGFGSIEPVGDNAVQLTAPIHLAHYLQATIETLDANNAPKFSNNVFYAPLIFVQKSTQPVVEAISALRLCPPDMSVQYLEIDDGRAAVAISGPESRKADYEKLVRPSIVTFLHSTEKAGFPL